MNCKILGRWSLLPVGSPVEFCEDRTGETNSGGLARTVWSAELFRVRLRCFRLRFFRKPTGEGDTCCLLGN
jgi:hypothetical protein